MIAALSLLAVVCLPFALDLYFGAERYLNPRETAAKPSAETLSLLLLRR